MNARVIHTLVAVMAGLLVACGGDNNDNGKTDPNNDTNNATNNATNNQPNNETNNTTNNQPNNETNNTTNNETNNDPCADVDECDAEGATCVGDALVECAPDANGCLIETETDCAANGQSCDANTGTCVDTCTDDPDCMGAADGDTLCNGDLLVMCAAGADGCLDATTQDCAIGGGTCDAGAGMCMGCMDDVECDGAAENDEFCNAAGDAITTCVDTNADGCLEAMDTACNMDEVCSDAGGTPMCEMSAAMCPEAVQALSCADAGTDITGDTANHTALIDTYECGFGSYPGNEAIFVFENPDAAEVTVSVAFDDTAADMDLFALDGTGLACTDAALTCEDSAQSVSSPEEVEFDIEAGKVVYLAFDAYNNAALTSAYTLSIDCLTPACGDGIVSTGEECDDGNTDDNDGCSANCTLEQGYVCDTFVEPTVCEPEVCGDGLLVGAEECDDGNTTDGDGCDMSCAIETGFVCDTTVEPTACNAIVCGDGLVQGSEACDDNNTTDGDGCDMNCEVEAGHACDDAEPSVCKPDVCGDGIVSVNEECDDGGTADADGCAADCTVEQGFECDDSEPSVCMPYPSIGTFAAGDAIPDTTDGPITAGESDFYTIEFTTSVLLSGTATGTTGDVDVTITNEDGDAVIISAVAGDESWSDEFLGAGVYTIEIRAFSFDGDVNQYTLSLSTVALTDAGSFAAGDAIPDTTGGPLADSESESFEITFTEDVMLGGSLTSPDGDMDLAIRNAAGDFITGRASDGDEPALDLALPAGSYVFTTTAFTAATSYTLSLSTSALSLTDIGTFAAADAIPDTVGAALTAPAYDHYTISFSEDVLLSGTLGGNTTGEVGIAIYNADGRPLVSFNFGDESWTDEEVPAGTYIVQVLTAVAGGDVDGYTLSMSTVAP